MLTDLEKKTDAERAAAEALRQAEEAAAQAAQSGQRAEALGRVAALLQVAIAAAMSFSWFFGAGAAIAAGLSTLLGAVQNNAER